MRFHHKRLLSLFFILSICIVLPVVATEKWVKVKITAPKNSAQFHRGDTVSVAVKADPSVQMILIVTSTQDTELLTSPPFTWSFQIPQDAIPGSEITITAAGREIPKEAPKSDGIPPAFFGEDEIKIKIAY